MASILIVDDHSVHRQFLLALLDGEGHRLLEAGDGLGALALADAEVPDLIISDIMMPHMDGYQFVKRLRQNPRLAAIPVIFYSASYSTREAGQMAQACGVRWVLRKPAAPVLILATVREALGGRAAADLPAPADQLRPPGRFPLLDTALAGTAPPCVAPAAAASDAQHAPTLDFQAVALRLSALIDMSIELAAERNPGRLLENACRIARHIGIAKYAVAAIVTPDQQGYVHIASSGLEPVLHQCLAAAAPPSWLLNDLLAARQPLRLDGLLRAAPAGLPGTEPPVDALIAVPIMSADSQFGWIYLCDKLGGAGFSAIDVEVLAAVAAQLAVAYENVVLYERAELNLAGLESESAARQAMAERLTESETNFRQLAENIREVFFLVDPGSTRMAYISPAYERVWGRSCASLYAAPRSWMEAIHPDDYQRVLDQVQRPTDAGSDATDGFDYSYRILQPGGAVRTIHTRGFPIRNEGGQLYRFAGIAEDVTAYVQAMDELRESERRYSDMLDNIDLMAIMLDYEGRVTNCNDFMLRQMGWLREEVIGKDFFARFVAPEQVGQRRAVFSAVVAGAPPPVHRQVELLTRSGARRLVRWSHSMLRSPAGAVQGMASIGEDITEASRLREALTEREAGLRRAQSISKLGHIITAPDGSFESWSATLPTLLGVDEAQMPRSMRAWLQSIHPADVARFRDCCIAAGRAGRHSELDYRVRRGDGRWIELHQVFEPLRDSLDADGKYRWFNTMQDVTEQKEQQARLARLSRIHAVHSGINAAVVRIRERRPLLREACRVAVNQGSFSMAWVGLVGAPDASGRVITWLDDEAGSADDKLLLLACSSLGTAHPACVAARELRTVVCNDIAGDPALAAVGAQLCQHGHRAMVAMPLTVGAAVVAVIALFAGERDSFDADQQALLAELGADLSLGLDAIDKEERLRFLAYYDALTELPNRTLFIDRLDQLLIGESQAGEPACVVLVNLDRFAQLNDALGRQAGDAVLRMVAQRLSAAVGGTSTIARIVGDTFAVVLTGLQQEAAANRVDAQLLAPIEEVFIYEGAQLRVSASAGMAIYPTDAADAETLLKHAEVALKKAKAGGVRSLYFALPMNAANAARLELESALHGALEARQFVVHYQPRVDLLSGRIVSAEALIRWQHPRRGLVPPVQFIPLCEETGLIVQLGAWLIDAVCAQQVAWRRAGIDIVPVAVNLSSRQFRNGQLMPTIAAATAAHGLEQKYLEFELTESIVMDDPDQAIVELRALKAISATLSLDDFGTGYSSLAYLQRLPFDFVKIDRSFVTNIAGNAGDAAIVGAVIAMAHSLKLGVVAEGVETEGQLRFLRRLGCDQMQGFLFSRAVEAQAFAAMVAADKHLAAVAPSVQEEKTLLIVDDEQNNLAALKRLLRHEGYRVLLAGGGEEALELLSLNEVQVIISDQRMPGMSGTVFLGIVKQLYPETIRIILSGYTDLDVVTNSVNQGAVFKFLTKPWDDDLLRAHIREAFRCHRAHPAAERKAQGADSAPTADALAR